MPRYLCLISPTAATINYYILFNCLKVLIHLRVFFGGGVAPPSKGRKMYLHKGCNEVLRRSNERNKENNNK